VLHHVSIEVHPDDVERMLELWTAIGFEHTEAPGPINPFVSWLEHEGTQVHLIHTEEPSVPLLGHAAVVAAPFEAIVARVRAAAFEVEEHRKLWGARRAFATGPGGHKIELMEFPPR